MDLNDPRRRLQVLNNASPSIRIASQPQQKLTVATAPTQPQPQISIAQPKQYNISVPKAPAPDPNVPNYSNKFKGLTNEGTETKKIFGWDVGKYMGDFGKLTKVGANRDFESNSNDFLKSYDQLGDEVRRIYVNDVIKKAKEGDQVALNTAKVLNDNGKLGGTFSDFLEAANNKAFGWTMNGANFGHQKDVQERLDNFTAGQIGKEFDPITVGTDIGLTIAGGVGAAKLVSKIPAAARIIEAGGIGSKAIPFLADSLGGGLTQEAISQARGRDTSLVQDLATGTAIDVGANLVFKGAGKFINLFRQGEKSASIVDDIIKEADPARIQQVMKIDNNLANYLAQETNPDTVKEVLRQMDMDPNIQLPDEVRKRLEEEGISAIRKKDTKYGAEYDPNDSSINFNDQSYATDTNAYHELGHHIFKNKLTPEEQALFKGTGEASQKAAGREGYGQTDINSEDFSDFMQKALTGRLDEVPEEFRSVVQKYAKVAASEAEQAGTKLLPAVTKSTQDIPRGVGDGFVFTDRGTRGLRTIVNDIGKIDSQLSDIQMGKVSSTREEIAALQAKRSELIAKAQQPFNFAGADKANGIVSDEKAVTQRVDEISKAQAGTSDAPVLDSVKTTPPEDAGTTFANQLDTTAENGSSAVKTAENSQGDISTKVTYRTDPKTGKNTAMTQEDVIDRIAEISKIPRDKRTVTQASELQELRKILKNEDEYFVNIGKPTVDDMFPGMDDYWKQETQKIMDQLKVSKGAIADQNKTRAKETAQRAAAGSNAYESAGGGVEGMKAKMAAQRGEKTKANIDPVNSPEEYKRSILDDIEKTDKLFWEKTNAQNAFQKMWGDIDGPLTDGDIKKIGEYYNQKQEGLGDDIASMLRDKNASQEDMDLLEQIVGAPRTAMTIGDASAPRQLIVALASHPVVTIKSYIKSFAHMFNKQKFDNNIHDLTSMRDANGHNYSEFMETHGLSMPNVAGATSEDVMSSTPLLAKAKDVGSKSTGLLRFATKPVRGYGQLVEGSNRGMSSALSNTRFELAKNWIDLNGGIEAVSKDMSQKDIEDMFEVFNTITGRGGKKGGILDADNRGFRILSKSLFSSRLLASRLNMINPRFYYRLSPAARTEAVRGLATFAATGGAILTLIDQADIPGVEVGKDPHSADFGKIKVGDTRYSILGGYEQYPRLLAQMIDNKKVNSTTGEERDISAAEVFNGFAEGKLNPLLAYAWTIANTTPSDDGNPLVRKDEFGEDVNIGEKAGEMLLPLNVTGIGETSSSVDSIPKGALIAAPAFFGVGVQTYGNTNTKNSNGKIAFGGKIEENMVTDDNGEVMMDEKNRPIRVKFDKDASSSEKKAALIKARKEAYTARAKSLLSESDADIYALGNADRDSLPDDQKDKYDQIKKWVSDYGKKIDVPESVKSDAAKAFYQKYNSMTKKDQEAWLKEAPDQNANVIATELNKQRVKGLPEFKPSNELSKTYAEYEKDLLDHPEYTNIDKQNKAKAFQTKAYKYNYTSDQQDIFNEGGSSDLKTLIDDGQISKADLDAAVKLDEELYNSGLTGSLKFSKKFRSAYGYGSPATGGSGGSGGSGSGGSKRAYLSAYVNSGTEGSKQEAPQFSSKRRTQGISFKNVSTPKKSNSKKVTINL